ncbi:MAG: sigma-70 family RNA polymerase sigma factor [Candidatus Peribacteraceae bacterium]|nr:sigma-70 family RNA polymerase sigma factor [Candidatus Peribacteraceae bacterium]
MALIPDNELAFLAQRDEQYFTPLFDRFYKPVYRYFYFRLRQSEDAEDLTSETFQKIYTNLHRFKECGTPFSAWIFKIARNCLIDATRKRKHDVIPMDALDPSVESHTDFDHQALDKTLLSERLWAAIRTLPQKYQDVWNLKLSSGLCHREIGEILGTNENNVSVMVHRSLVMLKKRLSFSSTQ